MPWTELIFELFFSPQKALQEIKETPHLKLASLLVLIILFLEPMSWLGGPTLLQGQSWTLGFLVSLGSVIIWLLGTAYYHLVAELFGGKGQVKSLLASGALIQVILIIAFPLGLIGLLLPQTLHTVWIGLTSLLITFRIAYLYFKSLRIIYGLSTAAAAWVFVSPFIAALVVFILLLIVITALALAMPQATWFNL